MIRWIAFDADDTLWENEIYYQSAQAALVDVLGKYCNGVMVAQALLDTETRNIASFGYGIKSFGLSMIETAIQLSNGRISAGDIQSILEKIKEMTGTAPQVISAVPETLSILAKNYQLLVITKGDLLDQERKLQSSGLSSFFTGFEVVNGKDETTYRRILERYQIPLDQFLMAGNPLRSDVLPVAAIGAKAVLVQHELTWEHEKIVNLNLVNHPYYEIATIDLLPQLVDQINQELK